MCFFANTLNLSHGFHPVKRLQRAFGQWRLSWTIIELILLSTAVCLDSSWSQTWVKQLVPFLCVFLSKWKCDPLLLKHRLRVAGDCASTPPLSYLHSASTGLLRCISIRCNQRVFEFLLPFSQSVESDLMLLIQGSRSMTLHSETNVSFYSSQEHKQNFRLLT